MAISPRALVDRSFINNTHYLKSLLLISLTYLSVVHSRGLINSSPHVAAFITVRNLEFLANFAFKHLNLAGSYWLGDITQPRLDAPEHCNLLHPVRRDHLRLVVGVVADQQHGTAGETLNPLDA